MKTRKYLILVIAVFVLIAGLLVHANSKDETEISDEIQSLEKAITEARSQEVSLEHKITDRDSFLEGLFFTQKVMGNIREEGKLSGLRTLCNRKEILRGLHDIQVVVEQINPEVGKYGLTQQILQTDTELRLRQNGIKIYTSSLPEEEKALKKVQQAITDKIAQGWQQASNANSDRDFLKWVSVGIRVSELSYPFLLPKSERLPILYINVNTVVFEESHRAAFSIQVQLGERAALYRDATLCIAPIWEKTAVAGCSTIDLKEYVREGLRDYLDEFINDYLAANPKNRSSQNEPYPQEKNR